MWKKIFVFSVFLIFALILFSGCDIGGRTLRGTVYYDDTETRVVDAEIRLDGIKRAETDYGGNFVITGLKEDSYLLTVHKDGNEYFRQKISPRVDNDLMINIGDKDNSTIVSGKVNISNRTEYEAAASAMKSQSNNYKAFSNVKKQVENKFIEDEIIVKFDFSNQAGALSAANQVSGLNIAKELEVESGNLVKFKIPESKTVEEMIEYFNQQPGVEYAEPNYVAHALARPNDTLYEDQWGSISANLEAAWDRQRYSSSIVVAVLDTGVIPEHSDLQANLLEGANFVGGVEDDPADYNVIDNDVRDWNEEASHGTHVAGIIGAVTNNNKGVAGVSWGIDIIPVRVLNSQRSGSHYDIAEGIYYSVDRGADIINLSLGSSGGSSYLEEAVSYADSRNTILVGAAGNDGVSSVFYPAAYPEVISVGALTENDNLASYSNYGYSLDLLAPGGDINDGSGIVSTSGYYDESAGDFEEDYMFMDGTSMAAAYVSGTAALLLEAGVRPSQVRDRLVNTAADYASSYGRLDAYGALLGKKLEAPYVFAAKVIDDQIIIESNSTRPDKDGNYTLYDDLEGEYYLIGWRDVNNSLEIDAGDYFGVLENPVNLRTNASFNNIDIDMYYVTEESTATSLNIENVERLKIN